MSKEKTYRYFFRGLWLLAAVAVVFAVNIAMQSGQGDKCTAIVVSDAGKIVDSAKRIAIFNIVGEYVNKSIIQMPVHDIPLNKLEELLDNEEWIDGTHLYIDNANILHIDLNSRKPVARIFDNKGGNYFLDSHAGEFTVFNIRQKDVVLFTGIPVFGSRDSLAKSVLHNSVVTIAQAIAADSFWMAQTDQVEYTTAGFTLHPVLGHHTVVLGGSERMDAKLEKLKIFYKQVLSQVGLHAFAVINVAYEGQVVVQQSLQKQNVSADQLSRNIERMADKNKHIANKTAIASENKAGRLLDTKEIAVEVNEKNTDSRPVKRTPKAIMPKKINNN